MSDKKLTILGIVAAIMLVWAVVQSRVSDRSPAGSGEPVYLIQGLDTDEIGSIIVGTGDDAVTLKREQNRFVVADKDNYPAKTSEINSLISKCLEIKTQDLVTDNPSNHEDLEVTEDKARYVIKFMTPEPNSVVLAGVAVGKSEELGKGTYVRLLSNNSDLSNKVYTTSSSPWFSTGATSYLEQELISVEREDIISVMINSPDGPYTLKQQEGSSVVTLGTIPPGKKLKSSDAQSVVTALTSLRFDDVKKQTPDSDLKFDRQYLCRLKDSTIYALSIAQKDDKTYIRCSADFTDSTPVEKASLDQGGEVESEEELKKKEAKLLARDEAQKFTEKHQGWIYEIPDWKAKNLTKVLADLLEDEDTTPADTEDPSAVAPIVPFDPSADPVIEDSNAPTTEDPNTTEST